MFSCLRNLKLNFVSQIKRLNFYAGQFYDAEYDMWFKAETHPLNPSYIDRSRNEGNVEKDR